MRVRRPAHLALAATAALLASAVTGLPAESSAAAVHARAAASPATSTAPAKATAKSGGSSEVKGDYDARSGATPVEQAQMQGKAAQLQAAPAVQSFASSLRRQSIVDIDPLTGTPSQVSRLDGLLTGPSSAGARTVALDYVRAHPDVFRLGAADIAGLTLARDYVDVAGIHHLSFTQKAGSLPLFGNGLKANVTKDGRLISISGAPAAQLAAPAPVSGALSATEAIAAAKRDAGETSTRRTDLDSATPVAFLTAGGTRSAWQTVTMSAADPTLDVIDAESGRVLYRDHLADDFASTADDPAAGDDVQYGLAYPNYPGAPLGGEQVRVDLTTPGWLPAGSKRLRGNNVTTYSDVDDDNAPSATEQVRPQSDGDYLYPLRRFRVQRLGCLEYICDWSPNRAYSWQVNRAQTATNNFVLINQYHDYLEQPPIGFTEAAGNFQRVNSTGQGKGGDAVIDQPMDGASTAGGLPDPNHIDNANFATPPDGQAPTMQMYLWHQPYTSLAEDPFIPSSGADEADIVLHEYTHGLSHRLVVDAANNPALDSQQGASMGEAWSDYYALDYLANKDLLVDRRGTADVEVGRYVLPTQNFRSEPTDCLVGSSAAECPGGVATGPGGYTYGDFGKITAGPEVHADGEIWAQTLWQLRSTLGTTVTDMVVTRGMELSPTYPSYLDMRNAIVLADQAVYGGAHVKKLWKVFAQRGMGFYAGTVGGDDIAPVEDFSTPPPANTPTGTVTGTVTDSATGEPVAGATVAFGGHDSGLPGADWATTTAADGGYTIGGVPAGTYPDVYVGGAGYNPDVITVTIPGNATVTRDFELVRDWAASSGGATVTATNGNEYASYGCGPVAMLDQSLGTGWSTDLPTTPAGKYFVVRLPQAIDLSSIQIDPANTCGDGGSASTADYTLETSTDGTTFVPAASGTFQVADRHRLNPVSLAPGSTDGVQYIRYTMLTTQVSLIGGSCPGPYSGCEFLDSSELEAFGAPSS